MTPGHDPDHNVVKHLEMIQGVINRLARNSFLIKGWSLTLLAAALVLAFRSEGALLSYFWLFAFISAGFWMLDSYFLQLERKFRGIYDDVRKRKTTDFAMDLNAQKDKAGCRWHNAALSFSLLLFYLIQVVFTVVLSCLFESKLHLSGI